MTKVKQIQQVTHHRFLNYFELEAESREGESFPYYMASRAQSVEGLYMNRKDKPSDGVMIYALTGEGLDHVVLVRQYRYPVGERVYEFPAGLVEEGEDFHDSARRELEEETGLSLTMLRPDPMYEKPVFTSDGMSDERCAIVYGIACGKPSLEKMEKTEDLEVIIADRQEVRRILREEPVALMCAYMLMQFLKDEKNPFPFPWNREETNDGETK